MGLPPAVNFFVMRECNLRCRFCYSTFRDVNGRLPHADAERVLDVLAEAGVEKITFVGGEPTLYPGIAKLIARSSYLGMVTTIVTNGARLIPLLDACPGDIDWVGLSIDSADDEVEARLGRGKGGYVGQQVALAEECRRRGIRIKMNSVITTLNWQEDMSDIVRRVRPERWKAFQVLPVKGQNDGIEDLLITSDQFEQWVERHRHLHAEGLAPVPESNTLMRGSYALIDPQGRFFSNDSGEHQYSDSILKVGVETAWKQVVFRPERFHARGGQYNW